MLKEEVLPRTMSTEEDGADCENVGLSESYCEYLQAGAETLFYDHDRLQAELYENEQRLGEPSLYLSHNDHSFDGIERASAEAVTSTPLKGGKHIPLAFRKHQTIMV